MKDQSKTKQVLIQELAILRQRVQELEQSESEWKKEKGELKKRESLFRSHFNLPLYGIAITSPEKGWIQVNDRICSIMGYSRDEIVCKTWSEMTHPDDLAADTEQFSRVLSGEIDQYSMCKRFIRKDGEIIWTNLSVGCVRNSDRSVDHIVAMVEDITSVKLAEETLRQERMLYEDLVTTEPAGVYRLRVKLSGNWQAEPWSSIVKSMYSVDMASDRYCNILGISHEEFVNNAGIVRDLIHPDDRQDFDALNMEAITRLCPFTWEGRTIRDHQTRWMHFESLPRVLDSETIIWTGIVYDITERKQIEGALQESEVKYRRLHQSMMDAFVSTDMEGCIKDYNESYLNMLGYAPEEIITLTYKDITPEKWHRMEDAIVEKQVLTKGYSDIYEKEYRRKDGTTFPVELRSMLLRNTDGTPISLWAIVRDITERKRAEEALKNSEYLLNKIFDVLPIGLWFADETGRLIRGNPAGVKIWGAEPTVALEEYGVFKARRLPSGKEIAPDDWALAHTIREGVTIVDELLEIDAFDGQKKIILNYTAPVLDDQGAIRGAIVVNHDISEREKLQAQLTQAQKMESVGRLAGGVAHDFNNMLGVILGHAEIAMDKLTPSQSLYRSVQEIRKAAERSADLTRQLLAFARKQNIAPKVLDLNDTVEGMLKMLRRLIGEDIDLAWMPGTNLWPVKVDPSQIDQILANLCVNARDAIKGVGKITIETQDTTLDEAYCAAHTGFIPGEYVMVAVSDDGCGMDKETQSHLFEPFFTTKGVGEGTGLGLATVYGIVKQNNGFINVHSEPGGGTTCKVYLPRYKGKAEQTGIEGPQEPGLRGHETVLVVEDEEALLDLSRTMLEMRGYRVLTASTPDQAIRLAKEYPEDIHLLLTDVVMPEMNGREMANKILSFYPYMKRLFMSGYTANVIAHHGILDKTVHFIQKPFSIKDLAAKVRGVLDAE